MDIFNLIFNYRDCLEVEMRNFFRMNTLDILIYRCIRERGGAGGGERGHLIFVRILRQGPFFLDKLAMGYTILRFTFIATEFNNF